MVPVNDATPEGIQSVADSLACIESSEHYAEVIGLLKECWAPELLQAAARRLPEDQYKNIRQWAIDYGKTK